MTRDDLFDVSRLRLKPLAERVHDLDLSVIAALEVPERIDPAFAAVASALVKARDKGACRILMMGAHVLRSGVQRYLFELMERGLISLIAVNGACAIHDFELALIGATTESVERYIRTGEFGLWRETGRINAVVSRAAKSGLGFGQALGQEILGGDYPHKDISLFAQAARLGLPVTVHVGIGSDIIHEHPDFDGAAHGAASHTDFLRYAKALEALKDGVVMNFGSAVMGPEVFLKALAMVRNVTPPGPGFPDRFTTLVCDLAPLPKDIRCVAAKDSPLYYFRPWKTMLARCLGDGGQSFYVCGPHAATVPQLWAAALETDRPGEKTS